MDGHDQALADVAQADFPSSMSAYLHTLTTNPRGIRTLQDLIDHTKADPDEDYPNHNVESFGLAVSLDPDSQEFKDLEATRDFIGGEGGLQAAMDRNGLDVLVTPTAAMYPSHSPVSRAAPSYRFPWDSTAPAKLSRKTAREILLLLVLASPSRSVFTPEDLRRSCSSKLEMPLRLGIGPRSKLHNTARLVISPVDMT